MTDWDAIFGEAALGLDLANLDLVRGGPGSHAPTRRHDRSSMQPQLDQQGDQPTALAVDTSDTSFLHEPAIGGGRIAFVYAGDLWTVSRDGGFPEQLPLPEAYSGAYSFQSRFENGTGTNPEELIGAAEAGCFTMSLANVLGEAGHTAESLRTTARVRLEQVGSAFNITSIELQTEGDVPGIDQREFAELARQAKDCTVSRALTGTEITVEAWLAGS